MCLGIPMEVVKKDGHIGVARIGGLEREVCLALVEDVEVGDYVIVHAGFAIQRLDEREALKTLKILSEMGYEIPG